MHARAWVVVLLLLPLAGLAKGSDAYVTAVDWQRGRFLAGTALVAATDGGSIEPVRIGFAVDACHRVVVLDLLYRPDAMRAEDENVGSVGVRYEFRAELWNATGRLRSVDLRAGSYHITMGEVPAAGAYEVRLRPTFALDAHYEARVRLREAWGEVACLPPVTLDEVEADPKGGDLGREWVEIHNPGAATLDLSLWTLATGARSLTLPQDTLLAPGARLVVELDGAAWLDPAGTPVELRDALGMLRDAAPALPDAQDDERTWQRSPESPQGWSFEAGTPGAPRSAKP